MARTKTEQATAEAMSASAKHRDTCRKCEAGTRCEAGEALYSAFTAAMEVWESETRQQSARRSGVTRVMATVLLAAALVASGTGTARAAARPVAADPTVRESRSWVCVVGPRDNAAYVGTFRSQKKAAEWCARVDRRPCVPVRLWLPAKELTK